MRGLEALLQLLSSHQRSKLLDALTMQRLAAMCAQVYTAPTDDEPNGQVSFLLADAAIEQWLAQRLHVRVPASADAYAAVAAQDNGRLQAAAVSMQDAALARRTDAAEAIVSAGAASASDHLTTDGSNSHDATQTEGPAEYHAFDGFSRQEWLSWYHQNLHDARVRAHVLQPRIAEQ